ncbi:MAG: MotA/TolQ/ExbB proton channel family protein [Candidatus Saccharibacteria bacterium]|nr:MotA/TolQ/ExbB proton channel family protein [Pseudorhodobacter sp.]
MGQFWTLMTAGGPIMFILLGLSALSLTLIVVKIVQLWPATGGVAGRNAALERWATGDAEGAMAMVPARAPADRVLLAGMQGLRTGLTPTLLEGDLARRGNDEVSSLSSGLRLLDLISMISPLLGLLGTVLGMVQSFQDLALAQGSANASVLAGGIWLALLTTAAGLVVAIPAAFGSSLLSGWVEKAALRIESAAGRLITLAAQPRQAA